MQAALSAAADSAVSEALQAASGVRRVPAENFHLTLAFLGSVALDRVAAVEAVGAKCAQGQPFEIVLDAIEHWRKPQVLCATASVTPPAAAALAEMLKRALVDQGFAPDLKPFRVHATVARKVRRVTREPRIEPVRWRFDSLHLIESETAPAGSSYRPVAGWHFRQDQTLP